MSRLNAALLRRSAHCNLPAAIDPSHVCNEPDHPMFASVPVTFQGRLKNGCQRRDSTIEG
jgi:hypothetical protein